ncbi:N-acetylglucosamine kinase [Arthrobacter castelli]|uniref:N-acetylglucosamine kinase n=1 Tax=Arthrobacter castelli TaxID=271431 RepID=UPI0004076DCC|nr:BadF/BadG/BcrA/BcrD ATPase family protein [Arthrobacter castelli]
MTGSGTVGACGVDIGGSGCRVAVVALLPRTTPVVLEGAGVRIGDGGLQVASLLDQIEQLAGRAAADAGVERIESVVLGSAGLLELLPDKGAMHRMLAARVEARVTVLASDMVTSHIGALGMGSGGVLAAGTGAVALGTDFDQVWNRVDGWGHVLGDAGSGAWIGAAGLDAAFRALDGRPGGSADLLDRLRARFGSPEQVVHDVYTRDDRAGLLATFVPDIAELAAAGDRVATSILHHAGAELASTGQAALAGGLPPRLALTGGLFNASPLLREGLVDELTAARPEIELVDPAGTALDGAVELAVRAGEGNELLHHPPFATSMAH